MSLFENALCANQETDTVDFKTSIDVSNKGDMCELIKDIVAMANSGGGVLLIGVNDDGTPSNYDVSEILNCDPADFTNKIFGYTGKHFSSFEVMEAQKLGSRVAAIVIREVSIPLVFNSVGNYQDSNGKTKTAFNVGTVYFRHGAKSEPGTSDDLQKFLEREIEKVKHSWLDGIRKVVEAPAGSQIVVVDSDAQYTHAIRVVDDPNAPGQPILDPNRTHPYRTKDVVGLVNQQLTDGAKITSHDLVSVRYKHKLEDNRNYCYKPNHGVVIYSQAFVDWVCKNCLEDSSFLKEARDYYYQNITVPSNKKKKRKYPM